MPTTLFVQQHNHSLFDHGHGEDPEVHYFHHSKALYIITEHEYVHSLISSAAQREPRFKVPPGLVPSIRIAPPSQQSRLKNAPRPLMATMTYASESSMGLGGAPGSPPDLTNSKSSKSSSFHSSSLSDIVGPHDLSHFEDINLDDLQGAYAPSSFPIPPSPSNRVLFEAPRTSISSMSSSRTTAHPHAPIHSFRDLTGGSKPRYPSLKGQVNGAVRNQSGLNAPARSMRRGFTSPSAPSLANIPNLSSIGRRSRSPSPSHPQAFPSAPRTLSRRSSRNLEVSPSPSLGTRRQSWQHSARKTVKELEAECDDEDDEVPEDAVIWNVPISPRPPQERSAAPSACNSPPQTTPSPATSRPGSSRGPSPHRSASSKPSLASSRPSPLHGPRQFSQPPSPNLAQTENIPPTQHLTRQRTNIWEETYTTLDPDAKKITEALEEYQAEFERKQEIVRQQPGLSRTSSAEETKPKSTTTALPPLRKNDPLIDPFQPSKEKQKHLSRTRPSWLPPKDPKEEKKHIKEYQRIMARVQEAERIEAQRQAEQKLAREKAEIVKANYWEQLLFPHWDTEMSTPASRGSHRQIWWNGVPPKLRGTVWMRAIGNDLEISETTFKIALEKAKTELCSPENSPLSLIVENTKLVFPELKMFAPSSGISEEQPCHKDLVNVCLAYASYRSDVDTLSSIHHIAGLFLLNMSPLSTFICICNLMNRPLPLSFLTKDQAAMTAAYSTTLSALSKKAPPLATHLETLHVEPREYLEPMFSALFCDRLDLEHAARFMDVYAIEGDKIPPRVAVGVLCLLEGKLYQGDAGDVLCVLGMKGVEKRYTLVDPDAFMGKVFEAGKS
ncbi:uncharacterized protein BDR25DRAFT_322753 [Lindgomyces ingoldianus]|uniref:Uncharacterized protein n=1 Tax=Lindgomyces ingoldianus TaxID=673940 RepID=A0ACB6R5S8_9PLEO|nr:uncharacterized protein BDR25DRAFT_322753 [Lindgomyces ingoldianus]KAF2474506.1 hypothetical protein BDR25DRAFT_322753 [Lindgomyces ingoldianus]